MGDAAGPSLIRHAPAYFLHIADLHVGEELQKGLSTQTLP